MDPEFNLQKSPYYLQVPALVNDLNNVTPENHMETAIQAWNHLLFRYFDLPSEGFLIMRNRPWQNGMLFSLIIQDYNDVPIYPPGTVPEPFPVPFLAVEIRDSPDYDNLWDISPSGQMFAYLGSSKTAEDLRYGAIVVGKEILLWEWDNENPAPGPKQLQVSHPQSGEPITGRLDAERNNEELHFMLMNVKRKTRGGQISESSRQENTG